MQGRSFEMMKVFVRMLLFGLLVCALGEMAQAASPAGDMALPDRVSNWGQRRNVADVMKGKLVPDSTASMKPADAIEARPRIGNAGRAQKLNEAAPCVAYTGPGLNGVGRLH